MNQTTNETQNAPSNTNGYDQKAVGLLSLIIPGQKSKYIDPENNKYESENKMVDPGLFVTCIRKNGIVIFREYYHPDSNTSRIEWADRDTIDSAKNKKGGAQ